MASLPSVQELGVGGSGPTEEDRPPGLVPGEPIIGRTLSTWNLGAKDRRSQRSLSDDHTRHAAAEERAIRTSMGPLWALPSAPTIASPTGHPRVAHRSGHPWSRRTGGTRFRKTGNNLSSGVAISRARLAFRDAVAYDAKHVQCDSRRPHNDCPRHHRASGCSRNHAATRCPPETAWKPLAHPAGTSRRQRGEGKVSFEQSMLGPVDRWASFQ